MRKLLIHMMLLLVISLVLPSSGLSKTGYVSDMLLLTFRSGPGNNHTVLKTLKSNTAVTVLKEENGFYHVKLSTGETGWVDKKFIIFDLPSALQVQKLEAENQALSDRLEKLEANSKEAEYLQKIEALNLSLKTALDENERLGNELDRSRLKYDTLVDQSRDIQRIVQENKALQKQNTELSNALEDLQARHKNSYRTAMIKWFLAGVGVLLTGWIIGSSVSTKKRRSSSLLD